MHNEFIISGICEQLKFIYDRISGLSNMTSALLMDKRSDVLDANEEMIIEELEQAQKLTLTLTREILGTDVSEDEPNEYQPLDIAKNSDGDSAFSEGELTENVGEKQEVIPEKPPEDTAAVQTNDKK
ncbi:MAG: hypothetical protein OSJ43_06325 [Oscillospiraceae bacterium]|nr:hypothetical protein [Oscillospiraceae bacterium]